tara:strand:+ start:29 stop:310 length:282 start_codon:yes stop_codon:yes gene_type:complete
MFNNSVEYISEEECDLATSIWIGNDCENNPYCLSSPENLYWNSGCVSIEENLESDSIIFKTNILGQPINNENYNGFRLHFYNNGSVEKYYLFR